MAVGLLWTASALATHEADHRYHVEGYVLDAQERPLANSPVIVRQQGRIIGNGATSSRGFYSILLHLHDQDLGKTLQVRSANHEATIRVTFTPGDATTRRVHHLNFIGATVIEEKLARGGVPAWLYAAIAVAVLVPAGILLSRRGKRNGSKQTGKGGSPQAQAKSQPKSRKRKKR